MFFLLIVASKENEKEKMRPEIEFIPDVIVKVTSDKPLVRKKLKVGQEKTEGMISLLFSPDPEVIKPFSCSMQLSMKLNLLIDIKIV